MTAGAYLVGLIGAGISTSFSPALHEREADRQGLRYLYKLLDLDVLGGGPEQVGDVVRAARDLGYDGLNITHPCKQTVIPHLDALDTQAAALGAVNTIVFRDGLATGHNTDVTGFGAAFTRGLPGAPVSHVVQIGAAWGRCGRRPRHAHAGHRPPDPGRHGRVEGPFPRGLIEGQIPGATRGHAAARGISPGNWPAATALCTPPRPG